MGGSLWLLCFLADISVRSDFSAPIGAYTSVDVARTPATTWHLQTMEIPLSFGRRKCAIEEVGGIGIDGRDEIEPVILDFNCDFPCCCEFFFLFFVGSLSDSADVTLD